MKRRVLAIAAGMVTMFVMWFLVVHFVFERGGSAVSALRQAVIFAILATVFQLVWELVARRLSSRSDRRYR